jgi:hypothetical protein
LARVRAKPGGWLGTKVTFRFSYQWLIDACGLGERIVPIELPLRPLRYLTLEGEPLSRARQGTIDLDGPAFVSRTPVKPFVHVVESRGRRYLADMG